MNEQVSAVHGRPRPDTTACHERAVHRVIAAMRERLDEELSLHEMAGVAIMSPFHFNRTFHHVIGMPPGRFLSALRLERARRLLLTTEERVTDVCFEVGYNSLGTFTRRFTEVLGVSPKRMRSFVASVEVPSVPSIRSVRPAAGGGLPVHGVVEAPSDFSGPVFVGLFRSAVPQGVPAACRVLAGPGPFTFDAPPGLFHVYALGVKRSSDSLGLLMFDDALRAAGGTVTVSPEAPPAAIQLKLRARADFDPPILLTLPLLLARRGAAAAAARRRRPQMPEAVA